MYSDEDEEPYAIRVINRKLKILEDQKFELLRARNKFSTINSRLPVELLVNIFCYIVPTISDCTCISHICESRHPICRGWVPVIAHVCNHWRTVALSTPSLWINCIPANQDAIKTYLDRSAGVPMVLDISFWRLPWESTKLLLARLPSAQGLRLYLVTSYRSCENTQVIRKARKDFIGSLKTLPRSLRHLTVHGIWSEKYESEVHIIPCLTDKVDKSQLPDLRHLYLTQTLINWNCSLFQNLHTLALSELSTRSCLHVSQLLRILKACLELEKLEISKVFWRCDVAFDTPFEEPISLSRLRLALFDIDSAHITIAILTKIAFSEEANVWIDIQGDVDKIILQSLLELALQRSEKPLGRLGIACHNKYVGVFGSILGSTGNLS
jgi:hypothetical protein